MKPNQPRFKSLCTVKSDPLHLPGSSRWTAISGTWWVWYHPWDHPHRQYKAWRNGDGAILILVFSYGVSWPVLLTWHYNVESCLPVLSHQHHFPCYKCRHFLISVSYVKQKLASSPYQKCSACPYSIYRFYVHVALAEPFVGWRLHCGHTHSRCGAVWTVESSTGRRK